VANYQAACRHCPVAFKGVYGVCFAMPQGLVNLSAFHKHFIEGKGRSWVQAKWQQQVAKVQPKLPNVRPS